MKITRRFTKPGVDVFSTVDWTKRTSRITNADGSIVFEMKDAEVPKSWSQLATDIMVSKYFRKAGVPQENGETSKRQNVKNDDGDPSRDREGAGLTSDVQGAPPLPDGRGSDASRTGPERSARQVIHRLAGCWREWGEKHGYFDTREDAEAFYDELCHMMLRQMCAPNSPQWFNTGLNFAYGITGPAQGHWVSDPRTGAPGLASDAYTHPQPHACFIQSIKDDLVGEGGIMDLWTREARLFKYGSGTGTNFSSLRGENEPLSGGGKSSGLMSFLKIGDRAAGAIKSGGTTRRAAKMVCLDADHPDIEAFVNWKVREELKVAALVEGMKHLTADQKELAASLGLKLSYDFNGEAYYTVSGQNSNNSVRLTDAFFKAVKDDGDWHLYRRTDGEVAKTIKARDLWSQICRAAWRCADPGLQYDTTINAWHTCPAHGRINASNPCSEYMFLDNTACNLASLNLMKFYDSERRVFDVDAYEHGIELWTIVLEISVLMAAFPSKEIAEQSWKFRTLGLGYANLGAMLMQAGIPYDSDEGRNICGALTAILTGRSYATSARMAKELKPFAGLKENRENMLRVIRNHRRAAHGIPRDSEAYEGLSIRPVPIDHELFLEGNIKLANAEEILHRATNSWDEALELGEQYGYRNAQVTVIAPTGTIGLLMDCDTTGVEPDFALVKFKKLAGGGYFKIANASLKPALKALGYGDSEIDEIITYVMGRLSLDVEMPGDDDRTFRRFLIEKGFEGEDLVAVENTLPTVFEIAFAFTAWSIPDRIMQQHGVNPDEARNDPSFNGLKMLGLNSKEIDELNRIICGTQTVEGAPHIRKEHLPVFDCANKCGKIGTRFIRTDGHIRMMAAAQPFITGAISKTINLPNEATEQDIADAYWLSWELGLKANALYRDGSKLSQPLNVKSDSEDEAEDEDGLERALGEVSSEVAEVASAISMSKRSSEVIDLRGEDASDGREPEYVERIVEKIIERPMRRRLPDTRRSITHHFNVAGHEGYLTVGMYDNGQPGELFITMSKEGSTIGGLMDSLGTAISVALQYGVPIESLVNKFAHQRFEPMGMTTNKDVPFAKSLVDYIFRWLGMEFIPGYREANAPQRTAPATSKSEEASKQDAGERDRNANVASRTTASVKEDKEWSASTSKYANISGDGNRNVIEPTNRMRSIDTAPAKIDEKPPQATSRISTVKRSSTQISMLDARDGSARMTVESSSAQISSMTVSALDRAAAAAQSDAPACDNCGSITVRSGTCYKCLNCGNSMGCS